ncbi:class C sortase [Periweissella cryptocerci]|uniref:Class C sortase n=1 Tax=Periweissella cryptocerci TaxID=2506420 RepID=A0A4P6YSZ2_9LACO|nr:class C sortase [Periweissella cryptocerci]QBO35859.1 class C sortase [Periweissella cryptocerci]
MKNKIIKIVLGVLLLVGGLALLAFPVIGEIMSNQQRSYGISKYRDEIKTSPTPEVVASLKKADEYNRQLYDVQQSGHWVKKPIKYDDVLADSEMMALVEVPELNLVLPVKHGVSQQVLKKGLGHFDDTSVPVGGKNTHAIVTGHSGLKDDKIFTELENLKLGDVFYVTALNRKMKYKIDNISIVKPDDVKRAKIVAGQDYVTLLTCTPTGINDHRLLVRGTRVPMQAEPVKDRTLLGYNKLVYMFALLITLLIAVVTWWRHRKAKRETRHSSTKS